MHTARQGLTGIRYSGTDQYAVVLDTFRVLPGEPSCLHSGLFVSGVLPATRKFYKLRLNGREKAGCQLSAVRLT